MLVSDLFCGVDVTDEMVEQLLSEDVASLLQVRAVEVDCTRTRTCTHTHMGARTHTHTCTHTPYIHTHTHHTYTHTHTHTRTHARTHIAQRELGSEFGQLLGPLLHERNFFLAHSVHEVIGGQWPLRPQSHQIRAWELVMRGAPAWR